MLVSVVIPAFQAQATIARAVLSLLDQSHSRWEAVIVSDDGFDYLSHLAGAGISDPRLRMVSTGAVRSGCHNARNVGMHAARGDFITQLDADDRVTPARLTQLLPSALRMGAAADNLAIWDAPELLGHVMGQQKAYAELDVKAFLALSAPLVPLVRRDFMRPREAGVELAEDVIANLQLLARIGCLPVLAQSSYVYNISTASMCHEPGAGERFDHAYAKYINRVTTGDGFGLPVALRSAALDGLTRKRLLNQRFTAALEAGFSGTFQHFCRSASVQQARNA